VGWVVLVFAALVALALLLREEMVVAHMEWVSLAPPAALAAWMLASNVWGILGTEAAREAERTLVCPAGLGALLAWVARGSVRGTARGCPRRHRRSRVLTGRVAERMDVSSASSSILARRAGMHRSATEGRDRRAWKRHNQPAREADSPRGGPPL
jgi:hypothetical protein